MRRREIFVFFVGIIGAALAMEAFWPALATGPFQSNRSERPLDGLVPTDTVVSYGRLEASQPFSHTFWLTNISDRPVRVLDAKASCGCTVTEVSHEPVQPGGRVPLRVKIDWSGRSGRQEVSVRVLTDHDKNPLLELNVLGELPRIPMLVPAAVRLPIGQGPQAMRVVQISRGEGSAFRITAVRTDSPAVRVARLDESWQPNPSLELTGGEGRFAVWWDDSDLALPGDEQDAEAFLVTFETSDAARPKLGLRVVPVRR